MEKCRCRSPTLVFATARRDTQARQQACIARGWCAASDQSACSTVIPIGPAAATQLHTHDCEERARVGSDAIAQLCDVQHRMCATDPTWAPADVSHRFFNPSGTRNVAHDAARRWINVIASCRARIKIADAARTRVVMKDSSSRYIASRSTCATRPAVGIAPDGGQHIAWPRDQSASFIGALGTGC